MKRPDLNQLALYVIAILLAASVLYAAYNIIIWVRGDPAAEPVYTIAATAVSILLGGWTWLRRSEVQTEGTDAPFDIISDRNQRVRSALMENAQAEIVAGYLQDALQEIIKRLDLDKRYQPEALRRQATQHRPGHPDQPIPTHKPIKKLFEESGRSLLILGAPGSGKTFTLAELARDLLAEAQTRPTAPVPIILNLASWATRQLTLLDWLVETLNIEQGMGSDTARTWVSHGAFILLLDGLDEVADDLRNDCVAAINTFRTQYTVEIAIASRLGEYENLQQQLNLGHAIRLLPLTDTQIFDYLAELGPDFDTIKEALTHDRGLHRLAQTPLMLHIIAIAYRDFIPDQLQPLDTIIERRRHLYDAFIQRRLDDFHQTQLAAATYTPGQALYWLTWLARRMKALDQTNFYIERLQANWLIHPAQRRRHGWQIGLTVGMVFVFAVGLVGGLALGLIFGLVIGLVVGPALGLTYGLIAGLRHGRDAYQSAIPLGEALKLTWLSGKFLVMGLASGLGLGGVVGLKYDPVTGLTVGLAFGLAFGLQSYEIAGRIQPNQGIIRSRRTAWQAGLAVGLVYMLVFGVTFVVAVEPLIGLTYGLAYGLGVGVTIGLPVGLYKGLRSGGVAVINHCFLRRTLIEENHLPPDLIPYLDHMARLVLLQRVGGGYRFIHLTLRDHIARQVTEAANKDSC